MNVLILVIAFAALILSIIWLFSKRSVWEKRLAVLAALTSLFFAVQEILNPNEMPKQEFSISNSQDSPVTGNIETQNNYFNQDNDEPKKKELNNIPKKNDKQSEKASQLNPTNKYEDRSIKMDNSPGAIANTGDSVTIIQQPIKSKYDFVPLSETKKNLLIDNIKSIEKKYGNKAPKIVIDFENNSPQITKINLTIVDFLINYSTTN